MRVCVRACAARECVCVPCAAWRRGRVVRRGRGGVKKRQVEMYKEVDRNLNLTDVVSRVRFLKYDRLTKVMVYGWKDKIMTDKLMHALSTMTEIALLWNPCSDLFLMDREPYVLPHVCPQKSTPKPSDDGHNSPPFRAAARLQRTCDEHARQDDSTAKLQARAACL